MHYINNKTKNKDWHKKVYKIVEDKGFDTIEWLDKTYKIIESQGFSCGMCGKASKNLSAHHIKPRNEGGTDRDYNLIALCENCHNIAELKHLNKREILNYYKEEIKIKNKKKPFAGIKDWHLWVYGGYRRPE